MSRIDKTLKDLKSREYDVLKSIYDYRCLSAEQIYTLHYRFNEKTGAEVADAYSKIRTRAMKQIGVIRSEKYNETEVFFLTNHGVEVLRRTHDLPTNIYDDKSQTVKKGYHTAKDLEIQSKLLNHQLNLNDFVIQFSLDNPELPYTYMDEKDISQYVGIRPDGMISLKDTDIFLEMDMSTESKKQLDDKWSGYREFLNSSEYYSKKRKLIMLFIIEGRIKDKDKERSIVVDKINERKKVVKNRIMDNLFDLIGTGFDIYIGSIDEMQDLLNKKLVPKITKGYYPRQNDLANLLHHKHKFNYRGYYDHFIATKKINSEYLFDAYIYKFKEIEPDLYALQKDSEGRGMEFLVDDYMADPVSVAVKMFYFRTYNTSFKERHKRNVRYVVVVESLKSVYEDLKLYNLTGDLTDIYFTTIERLDKFPFHKALCFISSIGNVYHYKDINLKYTELEMNLRTQ